jgi:hypothetical protein
MRTAMAAPAIVVCGLAGDGASGGRATERTTNDDSALRHAVPGSQTPRFDSMERQRAFRFPRPDCIHLAFIGISLGLGF